MNFLKILVKPFYLVAIPLRTVKGFFNYIMGKKDSYWFRHDSTAGRGLKMRKMAHIYSHWGKGVYWDVVEILRDQSEYEFESDESSLQLLCDLVGCKSESRFLSWFRDCLRLGLFEDDGTFFKCPPLSDNMVRWESSKSNGSKGGRPKNKPKKNPTNNLNETIIEEESIEENNTYTEKDFIKDWNKTRDEVLKKPSHLNRIGFEEKNLIKELKLNSEDNRKSLIGFFKQECFPNGQDYTTNVRHFLNHYNKYLQAYYDKNANIYGRED